MIARSFWQSKDGNFSAMFAMALPMLIGAVAFAVDIGSMTRAHSKLQNAVDAAVLAASRIMDKEVSREQVFRNFLEANVADDPVLSNLVARIDIDTGINYISTVGTATADVELYFPLIFGGGQTISVSASAYESRENLEVVLALDNTGSMGEARMKELRKAAKSLVDILSTVHAPDADPRREVKAALVPFATAVNVRGEGFNWNWIDGGWDAVQNKYRDPKAKYHGAYFEKVGGKPVSHFTMFGHLKDNDNNQVEWKGCVEARPSPYNLSDTTPDLLVPDTLFVPYFAPDNPGAKGKSPNSGDYWNNSYITDSFNADSFDSKNKNLAANKKSLRDSNRYKNVAKANRYIDATNYKNPRTTGPNYACPTPIKPLTSDFEVLKAEIDGMIHWEGSGTNVSEGLAWSYRVLSPDEPYTDGAAFNAENVAKFVVVFTDGENTVFGASKENYLKSDYGAYGIIDADSPSRFGTTNRSNALTNVNTWTQTMCTNLKAKNVEVFTVVLGADTAANRKLYSECATIPQNYYPTSDVSQLDAVFRKIASRIAKLYITN